MNNLRKRSYDSEMLTRQLNHITDIPWPMAAKAIAKNKPVLTSCYAWKDYMIQGDSQPIVMAQLLDGCNINVLSLTGYINYHKKDSLCRVKLGVVNRALTYHQEGTGSLIFERDISYALDRKLSEKDFSHISPMNFSVNEFGMVYLKTNAEEIIEEDMKLYESPSGTVMPSVGDIILRLECLEGILDGSFTMTYTRE